MKARKRAIALAAVLLAAFLVGALYAGGVAGHEAVAAQNGGIVTPPSPGNITLPTQNYTGYVTYVAKSDLPRFELVGGVAPPSYRLGGPLYVPPLPSKPQRYVLLARADVIAPLKAAAAPDAKGLRVSVRIQGAPVVIPGLTRTSQAIVVEKVELLRSMAEKVDLLQPEPPK